MNHPISAPRIRFLTLALVFASLVCLGLLGVRAVWAHEFKWSGFFGNLLLAWIPYGLACLLCVQLQRTPPRRSWIAALFVAWLLFFPNAAYIVTDLMHLNKARGMPRWFDYILITAYAWTGLFLGYISLSLLHARVRAWRGAGIGWVFVAASLFASSCGIYVGRYLRWNSWDVLTRPGKIGDGLVKLAEPEKFSEAFAFSITFFVFSGIVYGMLHALAHLHAPLPVRVER